MRTSVIGFALAAIACVVLPGLARAQPLPAMQASPMRMMGQPVPEPGITVTGNASLGVPATSARLTINVRTLNGALTLNAKTMQPMVDALVKAGIDRSSIVLPAGFSAPGNLNYASISGTVEKPSVKQMQAGITTVGTVVASMPGISLTNASVQLWAVGCGAVLDRARNLAIDNAQGKARGIAQHLNALLGPVIALSANDVQVLPADRCTSSYGLPGYNMQQPSDYLTINVSSFVTVTYAIR